jgi:hypothetical protein
MVIGGPGVGWRGVESFWVVGYLPLLQIAFSWTYYHDAQRCNNITFVLFLTILSHNTKMQCSAAPVALRQDTNHRKSFPMIGTYIPCWQIPPTTQRGVVMGGQVWNGGASSHWGCGVFANMKYKPKSSTIIPDHRKEYPTVGIYP